MHDCHLLQKGYIGPMNNSYCVCMQESGVQTGRILERRGAKIWVPAPKGGLGCHCINNH